VASQQFSGSAAADLRDERAEWLEYYRHGGIPQYVLRQLLAA